MNFVAKIDTIFNRFKKNNPNPKIELDYINNFTLLVAVILSAQSTDIGVNRATKELFKIANTPKDFVILGEQRLKEYIRTIGLYNSKAKNIIAMSKILLEEYNSIVPNTRAELMKLPGVGRKSANVILYSAFQQPCMPVDTHIFRVSKRIGLSKANTPEKVEQDLLSIIPTKWLSEGAHNWLVLHGRYVCKAIKPKCHECIIFDECSQIGVK